MLGICCGTCMEISAAVSRVKAVAKEISRAEYKFVISRDEPGRIWTPPEMGSKTINCDGAWESLTGKVGFGVICRNSEGLVIFVAAGRMEKCSSKIEAEGMAILSGLKEAERYGFCRAIFTQTAQRWCFIYKADEVMKVKNRNGLENVNTYWRNMKIGEWSMCLKKEPTSRSSSY
ncbi:hypothetical protein QQ045_022427 [Rhodiola kirilowii]